ncbi:PREDICTED: rRNA-processing protein FYV7-like [Camelina sativa]|uniref:rRNA-processing protein FYV7-like n=1 Tax=Camelina sativa TaxID=90675 RepID=A0ABM0T8I1_CAMSA|nr:PREDICTED: rRNA-processing protein FYV7-like [Camelina sativa]
MKKFHQRDEHETTDRTKSAETKRRKNMKRLGGGGLSLQTFANMKSNKNGYNPALIKKQKEFYKNAKYVSKFRKSMKQQNVHDKSEIGESSKVDDNDGGDDDDKQKVKSNKRIGLEDVYKQTKEEMEKARMERKAMFQAKKEAKEEADSRRKVAKGKMMRKTRHGQPVMKYRIEHLLDSIKKSAGID